MVDKISLLASCVRRTKIKNLKAIHNIIPDKVAAAELCSKNKDKKSESNSQQPLYPEI